MRYALFVAAVIAVSAFVAAPAHAYHDAEAGQASGSANVRSGPSSSYEIIGKVQSGQKLQIIGCTRTWEWCDVQTNDKRGWVASRFLLGHYEGHLAGVTNYGRKMGLNELSFEERVYWGTHYSHTNFYKKRYGMHDNHAHAGGRDRYGDNSWDKDRHPHQPRATWSWTDPTITPSNQVRINN